MHKTIAVEAKDLTFIYEGKNDRIKAVNRLNVRIYNGEITALVGSNGSGKTTLGKLATGILKPTEGDVFIFGQNSKSIQLSQIGKKIGYSFQNPNQQLFAASVEEEIGFGLKYRDKLEGQINETVENLLSLFEICHIRKSFPLNLSWGEKRRVALASILALEPQYLILDEPTTGLDNERLEILNQVLKKLANKGVGMFVISHNEGFVKENADRVIRMENGEITDEFYC